MIFVGIEFNIVIINKLSKIGVVLHQRIHGALITVKEYV